MAHITLKDIAKIVGVSPTTASMVLNEKGNISSETRDKVKRAIVKYGYKRRPGSRYIGFIGSPPVELTSALQFAAAEYGYDLVQLAKNQPPKLNRLPTHIGGMIVYGGHWVSTTIEQISTKYPSVLLGSHAHSDAADSIWVDNVDAMYQAVHYLIRQGHRNIGFINGPKNTVTSWEKQLGFNRALSVSSFPLQGVSEFCPSFTSANTCHTLERILTDHPKLTAFISGETHSGLAIFHRLIELGYSIPDDFSLIVFRDDGMLSSMTPALTAIGFQYMDIARETMSQLVMRIHDSNKISKRILFKPYLIERDSVCPPRGGLVKYTEYV